MSAVTIYHNPNCSTSRKVLGMIQDAGVEPTVVEYLKAPPSREELVEMVRRAGVPVRDLIRKTGSPYEELGLDDPKWTDDQLIDLMLEHPILINRPIVVTERGVRLCRPPETVFELLPEQREGTAVHSDRQA